MRIHAFNFSCDRDAELAQLMQITLRKYCNVLKSVTTINTDSEHNPDYLGYGNGSGWPQGLLKLKYIQWIVQTEDVTDEDFILSIDSDVVFTSSEVFEHINPTYGLIGTEHRQPYRTEFGLFGHMSGAMIFLRGDIARKIATMSDQELDHIRFNHFKKHNITENEDVMLSYFAKYVGAESFDLGSVPNLTSGNFEWDLTAGSVKSFYHLNYCPTEFMGEPVTGKWCIPKVLRQKGIEL